MTAILLVASAAAVLAADQALKALVISRLAEGQQVRLAGPTRLWRLTNPNARWLRVSPRAAGLAWLILAAAHLLLLALGLPLPPVTVVGLGCVLGGAAGNLVDRLTRGGIVDYLSVGRWPTFNLADAAMVAGLALVAVYLVAGRGLG